MLPDFGVNIGRLPRELEFVRHLEEYDGPILSEYRAPSGGVYLEKWCAREGRTIRSLLVRAEQRAIAEYLAGRISMRDLLVMTSDGVGFILDRGDADVAGVYLVHLPDLPAKYLPAATAMHDESLRPEWATTPQSFLVTSDWDARLLAKMERLYLELFSFGFFVMPDAGRQLPDHVNKFDYDGGFPVVHAFRQIRSYVPAEHRARSVGVSANSPGVLTIDAPTSIAQTVNNCLLALPRSASAYSNLYAWSKLKPQRVQQVPAGAHEDIHRLCSLLGISTEAVLPGWRRGLPAGSFDKHALLVAGKLVAAFFRRLRRLLDTESGAEFLAPRPVDEIPSSVSMFEADDDELEEE